MEDTTRDQGAVFDRSPDQLVPDPTVAKEFGGVTLMTLYRWTNDPRLGFPPPVKIRNKNFRSRRAIEDFKARVMRKAISQPDEPR
jgi:predicted DNA-binding transcriptional regulator AlpA